MAKKSLSIKTNTIHELLSEGFFTTLNIHNSNELLLYPPTDYTDYTKIDSVIDTKNNDWVNLKLTVLSKPQNGRVEHSISFNVIDLNNTHASIMVFGYQFRFLKVADIIHIRCKVSLFGQQVQLTNAQLIPDDYLGRYIPKYKLKRGISNDDIFDSISMCFNSEVKYVCEFICSELNLPEKVLLNKVNSTYQSLRDVFLDMHFPKKITNGEYAIKTFRKIAALEVLQTVKQDKEFVHNAESVICIEPQVIKSIINKFKFPLTEHQTNAINDIAYDLTQAIPMSRLLSGDVGHGKTAVIQTVAMAANLTGAKVAIMTCNSLLVDQMLGDFTELDASFPILTVTGADKLKEIDGNPIIIGTTALLSKLDKLGWKPDFLVVDEQEKFSRQQREKLRSGHTNILEATATCIPRTGALITHGVMDVSILNQCPVEKDVRTIVVGAHQKKRLFLSIKDIVSKNQQVAIVYPIVDKKNDEDYKKSVADMHLAWDKVFPDRVGLLHGRMSDEEKFDTISRMKNREFDLLSCSTVVERGITLPSLMSIVVVNPERYGLSTLHQIRGRIARNGGNGTLFLLTDDNVASETLDRLNMLVEHKDGFTLAEADMNHRGFGDMNDDSESQHGKSTSKVFTHVKLMPMDFDGLNG